jgi:hypothetical protein
VVWEQPGDRFVRAQGDAQVALKQFQIKPAATGTGFSVVKVLSGSGVLWVSREHLRVTINEYN